VWGSSGVLACIGVSDLSVGLPGSVGTGIVTALVAGQPAAIVDRVWRYFVGTASTVLA